MTLVKFNNSPLPKTFNNLFDEFFNEPSAWSKSVALPPVNIFESKDGYHLELSTPGRQKEDFQVSLEKGLLTISFDKKEEPKNEELKAIRKEFGHPSFKRTFTVDDKIDAEKIEAKYENGILKFYLPKKEEVKQSPKQISIQ
jgi:HSP20 family protein